MLERLFRDVPPAALWLGLAGLIPFIAGAATLWYGLHTNQPWFANFGLLGQLYYGVAILSFVGAVHWGLALAGYGGLRTDWRALGFSVAPALIGWMASLLTPGLGLPLVMAGFAGVFLYDMAQVRRGQAPDWYPRLRGPLTSVVLIALAVSLLALSPAQG